MNPRPSPPPVRVALATFVAVVALSAGLVVTSAPTARAADESAIASTEGTDFWISFEKNYISSNGLSLSITGATDTSGTIEWPDGTSEPFTVIANTVTTVSVPVAVGEATVALPADGTSTGLGIHVVALDDVTVYGLNYQEFTSDAFVALPSDALGTRYRALSYNTTIASYPARLIVLASQDATRVEITPQETLGSRTAGSPFTVELDAGEVYTLTAPTSGGDISGTLVTADRPIAVYGTVDCGNVGVGACDTMTQQMFPTDSWGVSFIAPRFPGATRATYIRVLADQDGTEVTVNGSVVAMIDAGEFWEGTVERSGDGNNAALIEASKPVEVGAFMQADSYGTTSETGDPAFLLLSPYEQYLSSYIVGTPGTGFNFNGITVVIPTSATGSFLLNGAGVASSEWAAVAGSAYSTAQFEVSPGTYRVTADAPFGVFVYGANSANSYAYAGGTALSKVASVASMTLRTDSVLTAPVTTEVCIAVSVVDDVGNPVEGVRVNGVTSGVNDGISMTAATISTGSAQLCYVGTNEGEDTVAITAGVATSTTTVTWTPYADMEPVVVLNPEDAVISEGGTAYFETVVSGAPTPTLQWQISTNAGGTWSDIPGAIGKTLTVVGALSDDGNQYRVIATNTGSTAMSGAATLTVLPTPVAPTVSEPANATVGDGDTATFTVTTTGTPAPTVTWQVSTDSGATWTPITGSLGLSYTTPAAALSDDGNLYRAVASNSAGGALSSAATLTVVELPTVTDPVDVSVPVGDTATFTASASGTPTPTVRWQASTDGGSTWSDVAGATSTSYTTDATVAGDDGNQYRLAAANTQGTRYSAAATLIILLPPTVTDPADAAVTEGDTATFTVTTTGSPEPNVQWQVSTDGGSTWTDVPGSTSPLFTTGVLGASDDGTQYRAMVTNTEGTEYSGAATVTVSAAAGAGGLASTGAHVAGTVGLAGAVLLAGAFLVMLARQRRLEGR